jgi:predicted GNAT family acetyltransferase
VKFNLYTDIRSFYRDTHELLLRHEAQNVIILGNTIIGNAGTDKTGWRDTANWFMATVSDDSGITLTALVTPPFNVTLYATDNRTDEEALACLIHGMKDTGVAIPGVMSERSLAERFAESYAGIRGVKRSVGKSLRLYELTKVNPEITVNGSLRLARESDMAFLPYWLEGFHSDCFGESPLVKQEAAYYQHEIDAKKVYILEDRGVPVSIAKITRELQSLCGIGFVYTPPYFRRKGYATSCVAALSRLCLERGFTKCVLYTDLANPVSNSIYQKIGYLPISDSSDIKFV